MLLRRFLLVAMCAVSTIAIGQTSQTAQLSGRVTDVLGATVPGAHVTISNQDTGLVRTVDSDDSGSYSVPSLPVGKYRLEVVKEGFAKYIQTGIELQVNTNPSIVVALKVGAVTEQITVEGSAPMVETHSTGVGTLVDQQHVVELPLNGRNVTQLVTLSGAAVAAVPTSAGQSLLSNKNYPSASAFSIAGGQGGQTLFVLDGAYNMDPSSNVGLPYPFPDALQEFKVETSSLPANYGSQPGGFVNVITKSGANKFHGDVFEFFRNYAFNAANYFAGTDASGNKIRDALKRNQFGGYVTGPIVKDKVFFMGGYQGTRESNNIQGNIAYVATPASLVGDFTTLASTTCLSKAVTLPAPFVGNKLPSTTNLNQVALNFLKLIPTSTDPCGKLVYNIPSVDHENQFVARVDANMTSKQTIYGRYFYTDFEHPPYFTNNLLTTSQDASAGLGDRVQSVVVGHTYVISANTLNTFRASASRSSVGRYLPSNVPTATQLGAAVTQQAPQYINFTVTGGFAAACTNCSTSYFDSNTYLIGNDTTLIRRKNEIIFGGAWIHTHFNGKSTFQSNGVFSFSGVATGLPLADFEIGALSSFTQSVGAVLHEAVNVPSLYVQDNIKFTKNFTLNAGLRWDPFLIPKNYTGQQSIFDLGWFNSNIHSSHFTNAPVGTLFAGDPGMPPSGGYGFGRKPNFAPRVGIVVDPRGQGKETIRAGYGIFYGSTPLYLVVGTHAPFANPVTLPTPAGGLSNPWLNYPGGNPFPLATPLPAITIFPSFGSGFGNFQLHTKPTMIQQWNVSVQKQLPGGWLASASYIGNKTDHLERGRDQNPATFVGGNCTPGQYGLTAPGPCSTTGNENYRRALYLANPSQGKYYGGATSVFGDDAVANYNGMLLSATKPFARNFSVLTNYTYSHCLNESEVGLNGGASPQDPNNLAGEYGNCLSDTRHVFNLAFTALMPKLQSHVADLIVGHWQLSPIFSAHSGMFSTVTMGTDTSLLGTTTRPNLIGNPSVANPTISQWFNTAAFGSPGPGKFGNVRRGTIEGPGYYNVDVSLSRAFPTFREQSFTFRAEAFNLTNKANFGNPNTTVSGGTVFGKITAANSPRILQLAAKYNF